MPLVSWVGNGGGVGRGGPLLDLFANLSKVDDGQCRWVQSATLRVCICHRLYFSAIVHFTINFSPLMCLLLFFFSKTRLFRNVDWLPRPCVHPWVLQSVCKNDPGQHCRGRIDPTGKLMCVYMIAVLFEICERERGMGRVGGRG